MANWKHLSLVVILCTLPGILGCSGKKDGVAKTGDKQGKGSSQTTPSQSTVTAVPQKTNQGEVAKTSEKSVPENTTTKAEANNDTKSTSEEQPEPTSTANKEPVTDGVKDKDEAKEKPAKKVEVQLTQADKKAYQAMIAKHKGNVIVVDFWATWCKPCKEAFPKTVK